jgi:nitronate monooxygenase
MNTRQTWPEIIQGGMGVGISSPQLANIVSMHGQLGVVSGTAVALTMARKLMDGDSDGSIRAALESFPYPEIATEILLKYYQSNPSDPTKDKYKGVPMPSLDQSSQLTDLMVVANYVEVTLAKRGHHGTVGINLLEKLQIPTLPSLYGAMLAGVDYVLMGAGIPVRIPSVLTELSMHHDTYLPVKIADDPSTEPTLAHFSPKVFSRGKALPAIRRPKFLAIVSSATLAIHLFRSQLGSPDGFVIETPIAGGHNAPPRGKLQLSEIGEPVYGQKDIIDIEAIAAIGLPFWLAGGFGTHEQLEYAKSLGASGVQVGTAFAFCNESGMDSHLKSQIIQEIAQGKSRVKTDPLASPTGFPFKVVEAEQTNGIDTVYHERKRICDIGYLREPYKKPDGKIGYRCPSEPVADFVSKGGDIAETVGRKCLCNGLVATLGLGQKRRQGTIERALVTAGDDLRYILRYLSPGSWSYSAVDVLKLLLGSRFKPAY